MLSRSRELILTLLLGIGAGACAPAPILYPEHPLVDEILKVRINHQGSLTNRTCSAKDPKTGECTAEKIKDYPLEDESFRKTANKLNFLCNIGKRRFKICLDKPGFCRFTYTKKDCVLFFCRKQERLEEYLPASNYQFLLDANARCANRENYDLGLTE